MKKTITIAFVAVITVLPALGQGAQISVLGGFAVFGSTNGYNIQDDWTGTLILGMPVGYGRVAEISWSRQKTFLENQRSGVDVKVFDLYVDYYQIGVAQEAAPGAQVVPYGIATIGAVRYIPKDSEFDDEWMFAITLGGGVRYYINPKVGIRLNSRLLMPLSFGGGGMFCGARGCAVGFGAYSTFMQAEVSAGLTFKLGE